MSDKIKDGGPAFPNPTWAEGMTLRDWFAGMAMQALLASTGLDTQSIALLQQATEQGALTEAVVAQRAYDHADAMLKQRQESKSD